MSPLHYLSSRSDFAFEFAEIFVSEKRVEESVTPRLGESATPLLSESGGRFWFTNILENSKPKSERLEM